MSKKDAFVDLLGDKLSSKKHSREFYIGCFLLIALGTTIAFYVYNNTSNPLKNQELLISKIEQSSVGFLSPKEYQKPSISQAYAHVTGQNFEFLIVQSAKNAGFPLVSGINYNNLTEDKILIKNPEFQDITGRKGTSDYLLINGKQKVRIEAMWQQSAGSIDLRLGHFFILAEKNIYPEKYIMLIVDGQGWRKGLIDWYKKEAKKHNKKSDKKKYILTLNEFVTWISSLK